MVGRSVAADAEATLAAAETLDEEIVARVDAEFEAWPRVVPFSRELTDTPETGALARRRLSVDAAATNTEPTNVPTATALNAIQAMPVDAVTSAPFAAAPVIAVAAAVDFAAAPVAVAAVVDFATIAAFAAAPVAVAAVVDFAAAPVAVAAVVNFATIAAFAAAPVAAFATPIESTLGTVSPSATAVRATASTRGWSLRTEPSKACSNGSVVVAESGRWRVIEALLREDGS